jgi:hypothetical protein
MHWLVISSIFAVAAAVQGLTGAGYALVAAPALLLAAPTLVPVPLLLIELVLMIAMVLRERHALDLQTLAGALLASFPGAAVGVAVLALCPPRLINMVTSIVITAMALLAINGQTIPTTRWTLIGAGFSAGAMNSIAGMPGPPIALTYRPSDASTLRTNLSVSFLVMSVFSVTMLYAEGIGNMAALRTAANYIPAVAVGFVVSRLLVHRVRSSAISRAVLWLTLLAGLSLLVRTIIA